MNGIALIFTQDAEEKMHSRIPAVQQQLAGKTVLAHVKDMLLQIDGVALAESVAEMTQQTEFVLLIAGNAPLLKAQSCQRLIMEAERAPCGAAMLCAGNEPVACCVRADAARRALGTESIDTLEAAIRRLERQMTIRSVPLEMPEGIRIRTQADLAKAGTVMRWRINEALMEAGVMVIDPERTYIDCDVHVGCDTVIYPGCMIENGTAIGEGCVLYANCRLNHAQIGNGVTIESSVVLDAHIADRTTVGPYAYIRPGTSVGEGCRIGDFVEIKNSRIGNGTKVAHLTYVGDSDLGRQINLGCGVVFVNYDGLKKQRSIVGDRAFIGCNVNLVAPVSVGEDAYIAAGSTVTCDVPAGAMLIAREREVIKEGWVAARKACDP